MKELRTDIRIRRGGRWDHGVEDTPEAALASLLRAVHQQCVGDVEDLEIDGQFIKLTVVSK